MTSSSRVSRQPSTTKQGSGQHGEVKKRLKRILKTLERTILDVRVELDSSNALELLMATILSAQCTDERVNMVTPRMFSRYHRAEDYAEADSSELEQVIRSTGFYKNKAKNLIGCGRVLVEKFGGQVPGNLEDLTTLPGVGRKTANVILGSYFGKPAIVVDTHVKRVSQRLGLTQSQDPTQIEYDLQNLLPPTQWTKGAQRILLHGRYVCLARSPRCERCAIYKDCDWEGKRAQV